MMIALSNVPAGESLKKCKRSGGAYEYYAKGVLLILNSIREKRDFNYGLVLNDRPNHRLLY